MIAYPAIDPVAVHLGPLAIHWYGLMYLIGIGTGWWLTLRRAQQRDPIWPAQDIHDLIFYCAIGVIVGGRVGYMLFYDFNNFIHHPAIIIEVWQGGMSFHGGLLGVMIAMLGFAWRYQRNFMDLADLIAPVVPIGLGAGRIGNFINGELWGRATTVSWGMVFPNGGDLPRHPSQLYEFLLEGVVLFIVLWWFSARPRPRMAVSGLFLLGYGLMRLAVECVREPDQPIGFIAFGWLTMGQLLSLPMVLAGLIFLIWAYRNRTVS